MKIEQNKIDEIISLIENVFPGWSGFSNSRFEREEVDYKKAAMAKARELLGRAELERLIYEVGNYEEVIKRLEKVCRSTNLLFQGVPMAGDLNILYQESLNKPAFCKAVYNLLYLPDPSPNRLDQYLAFIQENRLPNKWTFPTYLLFMLFPDTEMFVKPTAMKNFLERIDQVDLWSRKPNGETYSAILQAVHALKENISKYEPRDMVDIQSLIWVVEASSSKSVLSKTKRQEFLKLYKEFVQSYLPTKEGKEHAAFYVEGREEAKKNYEEINKASEEGADITDEILLKFLPYANTSKNNERGSWIHPAPSIISDIRDWYQNAGWTKPEEWPLVAKAILIFVQTCVSDPDKLSDACDNFSSLSYSRGFQTGTLTPILNALRPDDYILINNKSRQVINHFAGTNYDQPLKYYSEINSTAKGLLAEIKRELRTQGGDDIEVEDSDMLDMFSHWLVSVKKYFQPVVVKLAYPFSEMFKNMEEANLAFDSLLATAVRLGVEGPDDPKAAFTLRKRGADMLIRMDYGNWLVLGFIGRSKSLKSVNVTMISNDLVTDILSKEDFKQPLGEPSVSIYTIPVNIFRSWGEQLQNKINESLDYITVKFSNWEGSPFRIRNNMKIAEAIFDLDKRTEVLQQGIEVTEENGKVLRTPVYPLEQCAVETGLEIPRLASWVKATHRKGQVILYGPPGTGKTYIADKLAQHLIGGSDGFTETVQFHPAYAYEDFVQGIRPKSREDGSLEYPLLPGRFLQFCERASERIGCCVLIIDEINRANLARVFGELMYLLEYRDKSITLAGGELFQIPSNVRIIGTMNTADRSIALVDHALRRRFAFLELYPDMSVLQKFHQKTGFSIDGLIEVLQQLNKRIDNPHYSVGISYFLRDDLITQIEDIWIMEIEPYLSEYFFDHVDWAKEFSWPNVKGKILP